MWGKTNLLNSRFWNNCKLFIIRFRSGSSSFNSRLRSNFLSNRFRVHHNPRSHISSYIFNRRPGKYSSSQDCIHWSKISDGKTNSLPFWCVVARSCNWRIFIYLQNKCFIEKNMNYLILFIVQIHNSNLNGCLVLCNALPRCRYRSCWYFPIVHSASWHCFLLYTSL